MSRQYICPHLLLLLKNDNACLSFVKLGSVILLLSIYSCFSSYFSAVSSSFIISNTHNCLHLVILTSDSFFHSSSLFLLLFIHFDYLLLLLHIISDSNIKGTDVPVPSADQFLTLEGGIKRVESLTSCRWHIVTAVFNTTSG